MGRRVDVGHIRGEQGSGFVLQGLGSSLGFGVWCG